MSYSLAKNKEGSALLISLIVLVLLSLASTVFVEKVWNFSKASTGIKDSNRAYYFSLWTIEETLMDPTVTKNSPWNVSWTAITLPAPDNITKTLTVYTGGTSVPDIDKWNSPFDNDYNIISMGSPVQLVIPDWVSWDSVNFVFRVPNIPGTTSGTGLANISSNSWMILWSIGYTGATLFANGEANTFRKSNIWVFTSNSITSFQWITNWWTNFQFSDFVTSTIWLWSSGGKCTNYNCILKLSLIRPVILNDGRTVPFLEYKITWLNKQIPAQYMILESHTYAAGYRRTKTLKLPQNTTSTALDFAVLQ